MVRGGGGDCLDLLHRQGEALFLRPLGRLHLVNGAAANQVIHDGAGENLPESQHHLVDGGLGHAVVLQNQLLQLISGDFVDAAAADDGEQVVTHGVLVHGAAALADFGLLVQAIPACGVLLEGGADRRGYRGTLADDGLDHHGQARDGGGEGGEGRLGCVGGRCRGWNGAGRHGKEAGRRSSVGDGNLIIRNAGRLYGACRPLHGRFTFSRPQICTGRGAGRHGKGAGRRSSVGNENLVIRNAGRLYGACRCLCGLAAAMRLVVLLMDAGDFGIQLFLGIGGCPLVDGFSLFVATEVDAGAKSF